MKVSYVPAGMDRECLTPRLISCLSAGSRGWIAWEEANGLAVEDRKYEHLVAEVSRKLERALGWGLRLGYTPCGPTGIRLKGRFYPLGGEVYVAKEGDFFAAFEAGSFFNLMENGIESETARLVEYLLRETQAYTGCKSIHDAYAFSAEIPVAFERLRSRIDLSQQLLGVIHDSGSSYSYALVPEEESAVVIQGSWLRG